MSIWATARRRSSREDWEKIYQEWAPRGVRYALGLLRSQADAEEAVQESFYRLWASRRWKGGPSHWGPLFFTTIRNFSIDILRRRSRHPCLPMSAVEHASVWPEEPAARLTSEVVRKLISELPVPWRDALQLRVDAELSYVEIAEVLQCTAAQVRTWIYRARRQLAERLREQGWLDDVGVRHEPVR